ncbi:hypothetical protein IQ255_11945 [Pleurocapsales cyanobacterium LEGE 10410]|nr:hypothetical protein [Pleurocapsales cyanobacterium LEGE 10410]
MNTLQAQISELRDKTDQLYMLVEQISSQIEELNSQQPKRIGQSSATDSTQLRGTNRESEYQLFHKDILVDDNSSSSSANSNSDSLAPDTQIRRLTAQLTAAYNRIAALEEQILTYRIPS